VSSLPDAVAGGHIFVALQPVVDLHRKQVFAYEALVRSRTPDFSSPAAILQAAIETDYMGTLGRALRMMAVEACPAGANLFLNVHPKEFDEGWLVRPDDPIFAHEKDIFLEITESVPLSHFRMCHTILAEIRSKGLFLVVDDLGAGYSNLKYIADLAPEVVKLDRELIAGLKRGTRQQKLVRSIVRMCEEMGARVVAEGIETVDELSAVLDTGAQYGQGYLLARPAFPAPEVQWSHLSPKVKSAH
jgi:EAL domain-containing protein (putative c-di-GMP-specific phosphodiesterase class I)